MKKTGKSGWLAWLLAAFLLVPLTGCGQNSSESSMSAGSAEDDVNTRYATLMGVKNFKETFKPRGRMTDQSKSSESAEEEAPVSLLVRNVDGDANVFYYIDATGTVDLEDLAKEEYIPDFQKQLNDNSDTYQYSQMELLDRGANYCKFKVSIEDKDTEEELSAEEETTSEKKSGSKDGTASEKDSSTEKSASAKKDADSKDGVTSKKTADSKEGTASKKTADTKEKTSSEKNTDTEDGKTSKKNADSKNEKASGNDADVKSETTSEEGTAFGDTASGESAESEQIEKDSKPMLFFYIEKGKKVYEIIGLDMEAEDATAFSESFQGILDEIVTIKEVEPKEEQSA